MSKSIKRPLVVLDDNPSEQICCFISKFGATTGAFMVPKVQPLPPRQQMKHREWDITMRYVGNNNSVAHECDFWHERHSFVDELEPEYFDRDARDEWRDICRGI